MQTCPCTVVSYFQGFRNQLLKIDGVKQSMFGAGSLYITSGARYLYYRLMEVTGLKVHQ